MLIKSDGVWVFFDIVYMENSSMGEDVFSTTTTIKSQNLKNISKVKFQ